MRKKQYNHKEIKEIGLKIREKRIYRKLEIADLAEMTGITVPTITRIEDGFDVYLSYFIEVCKALEIHPQEMLDIDVVAKPRFKISPQRKENHKLTERVNKLYRTGFFNSPKFVRQVVQSLEEEYKIKASSSVLTVVLGRLVEDGKLKFSLNGRQKQYYKKKS